MRILSVRFKNLNSLVGEWEIDLTHPAYTSEGFFAITGPTGAGKSTILDAICLALYGKTPRLDKITQSSNEIMSRQTGECFAEVTFETQAGKYCCHWAQHKARKRADGDLQAPRHEIADAVTGRVLESKLSDVAGKIISVTGMNYGQFTKSMLLAQGEFAVFLQAKPDDRAPILEQITGTDIYSRISISVHDRCSEERQKRDTLKDALSGLQLMTAEDEQQLRTNLAVIVGEESTLQDALRKTSESIAWLDRIALLEGELVSIDGQRAELDSESEAFALDRQRLGRAVMALELAADHSGLASKRAQQIKDLDALALFSRELPDLETTLAKREEDSNKADAELGQKKEILRTEAGVIKSVRGLDLKIEGTQPSVQSLLQTLARLDTTIEATTAKQDSDRIANDRDQVDLRSANEYLEQNAVDALLVERLGSIRSRFTSLKSESAKLQKLTDDLHVAQGRTKESQKVHQETLLSAEAHTRAADVQQGVVEHENAALAATLQGQEITAWRTAQSDLALRLNKLSEMGRLLSDRANAQKGEIEADARNADLQVTLDRLAIDIAQQVSAVESCRRVVDLLSTQRDLRIRVHSLEDERIKLRDGVECILCGSMEHPYAMGNVPSLEETDTELSKAAKSFERAGEAMTGLRLSETEARTNQAQAQKDLINNSQRLADADSHITALATSLGTHSNAFDAIGSVNVFTDQAELALRTATAVVQAYDAQERKIEIERASFDKAKEELVETEKKLQSAVNELVAAELDATRLASEFNVHSTDIEQLRQSTLHDTKPFGIDELPVQGLDSIQAGLTERRDRWQEREETKRRLEGDVKTLKAQLQHHAEIIEKALTERAERQTDLTAKLATRDNWVEERFTLYGDKNPDDEEARLLAAIKSDEGILESARGAHNLASTKVAGIKSRIDALQESINERGPVNEESEAHFVQRLSACGFADEAEYINACLSENERIGLASKAEALAAKQAELNAGAQDRSNRLLKERAMMLTTNPRAVLADELDILTEKKKELVEQIGGAKQRLSDNEAMRVKAHDQIEAIQAQTRELVRWENLSKLIGSSDGKKYRNFAQGVTFEMMIRHANRQLQKMTDRYLLIRNDKQPLDLNVIDSYQAGEIRSSKNLSGGESFIVSLSLALGLSHMASRNVRVDSLFLDEGFGTLDEDALDTALGTLATLQQDGKLIGVISHVSALKDRISTQIQIIPQSGGRSIIKGDGCAQH